MQNSRKRTQIPALTPEPRSTGAEETLICQGSALRAADRPCRLCERVSSSPAAEDFHSPPQCSMFTGGRAGSSWQPIPTFHPSGFQAAWMSWTAIGEAAARAGAVDGYLDAVIPKAAAGRAAV